LHICLHNCLILIKFAPSTHLSVLNSCLGAEACNVRGYEDAQEFREIEKHP
jgi:hypothetical protein